MVPVVCAVKELTDQLAIVGKKGLSGGLAKIQPEKDTAYVRDND